MLRSLRIVTTDLVFAKRLLCTNNQSELEINQDILPDLHTDNKNKYGLKYWELYKSTPKHIDPSLTTVFLFPGQGSQFVGMGRKLLDIPSCKLLFDATSEYLKMDIAKICIDGPEEKINKTIYCQPAIYTVSLATLEFIRLENPQLIENCIATAGNSLGEITSLVFAGSLTFEQGLHFVRIRAEHMQKACNEVPGGLLTTFIGPKSNLTKAMGAAKQYCRDKLQIENPICQISTYLFTEAKIIGGHVQALEFIETFAKDFHIRGTKRLNVVGAFHTPLMASAFPQCKNALLRIGPIKEPNIHVLSNVTGTLHTSNNAIKRLLAQQIVRPVLWEQILMRLYMRPPEIDQCSTIEVGPGSQLGQTVKRINAKAFTRYKAFQL